MTLFSVLSNLCHHVHVLSFPLPPSQDPVEDSEDSGDTRWKRPGFLNHYMEGSIYNVSKKEMCCDFKALNLQVEYVTVVSNLG